MKTILLAIVVLIATTAKTQTSDQFIYKCNMVAFYLHDKDKWSDFYRADNTFVINYNEHGDIWHIGPNVKELLVRTGEAKKGKTDEGEEYQIVKVKDPEGLLLQFQVFRNAQIGVKLIYLDVSVQFSHSNKIELFN